MCLSSLFIMAVCNAASANVCAQTICHFCLHPNASVAQLCDFFFFSSRRRLEAVRAITTWGREWHLESDGWKGIKFSLEPTVWNWYSNPPLLFPPPYFPPHKQATALTYSNRRSSLSLVVRPVLKKQSGKREWREKEPRGRKLSNCTFELMPFNLSLSHWVIKKNKK